jgi:hypothetical protein
MDVLSICHAFSNATILNNRYKQLEAGSFGTNITHARIREQAEASDGQVQRSFNDM